MDYPQHTRDLLARYWQGETTTEEEKQLRKSIRKMEQGEPVIQAYFQYLEEEAAVQAPVQVLRKPRRKLWTRLSIAASIGLLIAAAWLIQDQYSEEAWASDHVALGTIEDPQEAYAEAKQALLLVSRKMQGTRSHVASKVAKAQPYTELIKPSK